VLRRQLRYLAILIFALTCPSILSAQTILNFPRVISNSSLFTGLAVSNPTAAEVSVTFTAFLPDGTQFAATGVQNPVTMKIPAGGQAAKLSTEVFGSRDFNGWVQATSSSSGLTGFFLNGASALTDLDGAGSVAPSSDFLLPFASEDAVAKTEITIVNINSDPSNATLTLYTDDGTKVATINSALPARGLVRQTLSILFPNTDLSRVTHIRVQADRPVIGHEVVANYALAGTAVRRETAALSGQEATPATTYALPEFATGGGWVSLFGIANAGGVGQEVTVTAYKEDGTLWNIPGNPKRISLQGNGAFRGTVGDLFGFPSATLATGWLQVTASLGYISSYIAYGNTATPSFAAVTGTDSTLGSQIDVFSQVAEGIGFFTGLTLVNPGTQDATLQFYTLRPDGTTVGTATVIVHPKQRIGELFTEILPSSLLQVGGWALIRSNQPLVAAVLFGSTNGFALANVPQQIPTGDFTPPAQVTGAINGTIRGNGIGIANVQLTLSGPVTATTTTDDQGRYIFSQLPAGDYKVTPVRAGAQFAPSSRSITINRQNIDAADFDAGGLSNANAPGIQFITPASTFAGNAALNVRVFGANFTPTSVVQFNGQNAPTTFISSAELQAVISADQLKTPSSLQVTVLTPPPGGGASTAIAFTVNPVPSSPLIRGRATVGSFPAGVAIDTTRNTALITNQSSDSVTVLDLKTLQVISSIPVGRSPAEGIAIHAGKNIALVANPGSNNVSVIDLQAGSELKKIAVGTFPVGVAINPTTNKALVTNANDGTVSIIDLNSLTVTGQISAGLGPEGIAIEPISNKAVVTNTGSNDAWILDLNSNSVLAKISVGQFPRGVAISSSANVAVVANANSNDVSVIDLAGRTVLYTVKVDSGPTGVAIHELTNSALITNSGIIRGSNDFSALTTVSVLDIARRAISNSIPVGSAAFGISVNQDAQEAVVADFGSNDVMVLRVPNPVPLITDVNPKTFPAGGGGFTLTITGSGFIPTSVVTLNGQALPTTYISATQLQAQVSAAVLQQLLQVQLQTAGSKIDASAAAAQGPIVIGVLNSAPGGGSSPPPSNPGANQITLQNGIPVLISISPTDTSTGAGSFTLTLNGNNFNGSSVINVNTGSNITVASVSPSSVTGGGTTMTATIPANLAAGTYSVSVNNPGAGTSGGLSFTVSGPPNPAPTVTSVAPAPVPAGSGPVTVTVVGTGFIAATTASLGGVKGSFSGNTVSFALSASDTQTPGTINGQITNPAPGGGFVPFSFTILSGTPSITGFSPTTANVGSPDLTITVSGSSFSSTSKITFAGTTIPTQFDPGTPGQLKGTVKAAFLLNSAIVGVGVTNHPVGGSADGGSFSITSVVPVIDSLDPSNTNVPAKPADLVVKVNGKGFAGNAKAKAGTLLLETHFDSTTVLEVTLPATLLAQSGGIDIAVKNPTPGGGTATARFNVNNPVPGLTTVSPNQLRGDQTDVVFTITGQNFVSNSTVMMGGTALVTKFVSSTQLTAAAPTPLPLGKVTVTVNNPSPGGGPSNGIDIEIAALAPTITSVSPSSVAAGQTIQVTGTNFGPGSIVLMRGQPLPTSASSATLLTATIPLNAQLGTADIVVRNPATSTTAAQDSASVTITVVNPVPSITSLSPNPAIGNSTPQTITVTGAGFIPTSSIQVNGSSVSSTYIDGQTLSFLLSGVSGSSASVQVFNPAPGGGPSNVFALSITNLPPVISALGPTSGTAGTTIGLTVSGSNFIAGATINFAGAPVSTAFTNSTSLFATVTLGPVAGSVQVTVTNPDGTTSTPAIFQITAVIGPPPPSVPTLTSITPSSGLPGTNVAVTLAGTNFIPGATVLTISGSGVTGTSVTVTSGTSLTATFVIGPAAPLGAYNVAVSTAGGTSGMLTFTVASVVPVYFNDFETPATAFNALTASGTLSGLSTSSLPTDGGGISSPNQSTWLGRLGAGLAKSPSTSELVTLSLNGLVPGVRYGIAFDLLIGASWEGSAGGLGPDEWRLSVNSGASSTTLVDATFSNCGVSNQLCGALSPQSYSDATPLAGPNGSLVPTTGADFSSDTNADFSQDYGIYYFGHGAGNPLLSFTASATTATLTFERLPVASGDSSDEYWALDNISVAAVAAPSLSSISPSTGAQGFSVPVTLTGTNFVTGATAITVGGTGVTVTSIVVSSSTSVTATLVIDPAAATGARNVTVTTAGGSTGAVPFTITSSAPTLTSVSPSTGGQGFSVPVTLTGTNFVTGATAITVSGTGVTVTTIAVSSGTSMTATFVIDPAAALGARNVSVTTASGSSGTVPFTITSSAPTLTSVSPSTGGQGFSVPVTLTGTNFVTGATAITVSGTGVTVTAIAVSSGTSMTATFVIDPAAALGARNVSVTTASGSSGAVPFTITSSAPTMASIGPSSGVQGTAVPVTLTGTNFVIGATTITFSGSGVTVTLPSVSNSTSMTATFVIDPAAAPGAGNVFVTTASGSSNALPFTITANPPTLTSITPSSGLPGTNVPITLAGTNFIAGATALTVSGSGVTGTSVSVTSGTSLTATLVISPSAPLGNYSVAVSTAGGTSGTLTFTVASVAPVYFNDFETPATAFNALTASGTLSGLSTSSLPTDSGGISSPNQSTWLGRVGAGLAKSPTTSELVTLSLNGLVPGVQYGIAFDLLIGSSWDGSAGGYGPEEWRLSVNSGVNTTTLVDATFSNCGTSNQLCGASSPQSYSDATPLAGPNGSFIPTTGADFSSDTNGDYSQDYAIYYFGHGAGNPLLSFTASATTATLTFERLPVNSGDSSDEYWALDNISVAAVAAPALSSISPSTGAQGFSVPVTLTGSNFVLGATTITISGSGVTATLPSVTNSTSMTATLVIDPAAATGARNVSVTTAGGSSSSVSFAVTSSAPTLASVSPSTGAQGFSVPVTLTGTNFVAGATAITVGGTGVTVTSVAVSGGTSMTATFVIDPAAPTGPRNVSVTNASGTSNAVVFTITSSAPTLTSVSPSTGAQGFSVPVTLTGTNFVLGATTITFSESGVTATLPSVSNSTSMTATFVIDPAAPLGPNNVSVTTASGTSGAVPFTVTSSAPTLASISPSSGVQGTAVPVTLTGTNFVAGATAIAVSGAGVSVTSIVVTSSTSMTATFVIDPTASIGADSVSVTTASGTSVPMPFTVNQPPPALTAISPASGTQGTTVPVLFTGTGFIPGNTSIIIGGPGVTALSVNVLSGTSLAVAFVIDPAALPGLRTVAVNTSSGTSVNLAFTVNSLAPILTSIAPNSGAQGATFGATLYGKNLRNATSGAFSGNGVTASITSGTAGTIPDLLVGNVTDSSIKRFNGSTGAYVGDFVPAGSGGLSGPTFFVFGPDRNLYVSSCTTANVKEYNGLTGAFIADFTPVSAGCAYGLAFGPDGNLYLAHLDSAGAGRIKRFNGTTGAPMPDFVANGTAGLNYPQGLVFGPDGNLYITNNLPTSGSTILRFDGTTGAYLNTFATIASGNPTSLTFGADGNLYASMFNGHVIERFNGVTGSDMGAFVPTGVGNLTWDVDIAFGPDGTLYETERYEASVKRFDLTGNFIGNSVAPNSGGLSEIFGLQWFDPSVTAQVTVTAGAALGARDVSVTTPGGSSTLVGAFTVTQPAPTLSSINPSSGTQWTVVPVVLSGANFIPGATVLTVGGSGITVTSVVVTSGTAMTASFVIDPAAATGARGVTVSTANGTSGSLTFTVVPPAPPGLTGIDVNAGLQGATVPVNLTGSGFAPGATMLTASGSGIVVEAVNVTSPTSLSAVLLLNGAPGLRGLTVSTAIGTSNSLGFTINSSPLESASAYVSTHLAGSTGGPGYIDGSAGAARFNFPFGIWSDGTNLYVSDRDNSTIRKIVIATGATTTLAGTPGVFGFADGVGTEAMFATPQGLWGDGAGNLYVADSDNAVIRKIVIATGAVTTIAGSPDVFGWLDGVGNTAQFDFPTGLWGDGLGNLYVADSDNDTIRQITIATGAVVTIAGSPFSVGFSDGFATDGASFDRPQGLWGDGANLYIADTINETIRKLVLATSQVSTLAGSPLVNGSLDGTASGADFSNPTGLWGDGTNLYVGDSGNHTIRKIVIATAVVTTFAGGGMGDGIGTAAGFIYPTNIWGDGTNLYVADSGNSIIRKIVTASAAVTTISGAPLAFGSANGTGAGAGFFFPGGVWGDGTNLYIADGSTSTIRKVVSATGTVSTFAGGAVSLVALDGTGTAASFNNPQGLWGDGVNLYVADSGNNTIRKINLSTAAVTTIAGSGDPLVSGFTDGTGTNALFNFPIGIWGDGSNLYISDSTNATIRKIVLATGAVTTIAGTPRCSDCTGSGVDGNGPAAQFYDPQGIWGDGINLYIADSNDNSIRKLVLATGDVTTLAGVLSTGGMGPEDGVGNGARFNFPSGITGDGTFLYVADTDNDTIRKIEIATATVTTLAGNPQFYGSQDGIGRMALFTDPFAIWSDGSLLYFTEDGSIRTLAATTLSQPTLSSLTPSSGAAGSHVALTLNGAGFDPNSVTVAVAAVDVTASPAALTAPGTVLTTVSIDPAAVPGPRAITVSTSAGTSNALTFTVIPGPPILSGINPASGSQGTAVPVTLTGLNFAPGATALTVSGTGITVTSISVTSGTAITATFVIDPAASTGGRSVTVSTSAGTSGALTFTVTPPPAPLISGLNTASGVQGAVVPITITGSNFILGATSVSLSGSGGIVESVSVASSTTVGATLILSGSTGGLFLTVTTPGGTSNAVPFTVNASAITSSSMFAVTTLAGTGGYGSADGTGNAARFSGNVCSGNCSNHVWTDGTNVFLTDQINTVRKIVIATGVVTTVAGTPNSLGSTDGVGAAARFSRPAGIWGDGTSLYVADYGNSTIRQIELATGKVTTLAGVAQQQGNVDGTGSGALFSHPIGVWGDGAGNLYVADSGNNTIRKIIIAGGVVSTFAGSGTSGGADGVGTVAQFSLPQGVWGDATNMYVTSANTVRQIVIASAQVTTLAGLFGTNGFVDAAGSAARFNGPFGLWGDGTNLYVSDFNNGIRKIVVASGQVTTLAGGTRGIADGAGNAAQFDGPYGLVGDGANLYITDTNNHTVRKLVIATAAVTTLAGRASANGSADGSATAALFGQNPFGVWGYGNNLYVADTSNHTIRQVTISTGAVTTLAGLAGTTGSADGVGGAARFNAPHGIWSDGTNLYVVDYNNNAIRKVVIATGSVTTLAGSGSPSGFGSTDGIGSAALFTLPSGIWGDGTNLFVADTSNCTIRKVAIATASVTTLAGTAGSCGSVNGTGAAAQFKFPQSLWGDGTNLYVSEAAAIRQVVIATGAVTTVAGLAGSGGFADGVGTNARFFQNSGIWGDGTNLYVGDSGNGTIRKIVIATGTVSTPVSVAQNFAADDSIGMNARFFYPQSIWGDGSYLYATDQYAIRKLGPVLSPTLTSLTPSSGAQGSTVSIVVNGTYYVPNGTVATVSGGSGITVTSLTATGPGTLAVNFVIDPAAATGSRSVAVSTVYGASSALNFTIAPPVPTLTNISPSTGVQGTTVALTLSGTNFVPGATTVAVSGAGVTVTSVVVSSVNVITANFVIDPAAATGSRNVTVSTANGTSGSVSFSITAPPAPVITALDVPSGPQGAILPVTITGSNFVTGATSLAAIGTGLVITSANATSATSLSATLQLSGTTGIYSLTASTVAGTSAPFPFTINANVLSSATQMDVSHFLGAAGGVGIADGTTGSAVRFNDPLAVWSNGTNLYVTDTVNSTIRQIVIASGATTVFAGLPGVVGSTDGTALAARFSSPNGIWGDGVALYVTDSGNYTVRRVLLSNGVVQTLAGAPGVSGGADGTGSTATFNSPIGVWADSSSSFLYVADNGNNNIRRITIATGAVVTVAGSTSGVSGSADGTGTAATFAGPVGIWGDGTNLYVSDSGNNTIRRIAIATGVVTTVAGSTSGFSGSADGTGTAARFSIPWSMWGDGPNLYVGDFLNNTVRKIVLSSFAVSTIAGSPGTSGWTDAIGAAARFSSPNGLGGDPANIYVAEGKNNAIRAIAFGTNAVTTLAGQPVVPGSANAGGNAARFNAPYGVAGDGTNLYIADTGNNEIRKAVISTGNVTTFAGSAGLPAITDGTGAAARFFNPIAITSDGVNLYVADSNTIRKVNIATSVVTTIAGSFGSTGSADGIGAAATFNTPQGLWSDGTNLYVADAQNNTIRKVVIATGAVTTIAGTANSPVFFLDAAGTAARFFQPAGLWGDGTNLYISDSGNNRIRKMNLTSLAVTTLAGSSVSGTADGTGAAAQFSGVYGLWGDGTNLYVAEVGGRIRKVTIGGGTVTTMAGRPPIGFKGADDGIGSVAQFNSPYGIWGDGTFLYVADSNNDTIRKMTVSLAAPVLTAAIPAIILDQPIPSDVVVGLTGDNFAPGATTVTVSGGSGLTVGAVQVISRTLLTVTVTVNTINAGFNFTVTTPGGTSNSVPFTVSTP
jgi:YVTN family beta-propeller protein